MKNSKPTFSSRWDILVHYLSPQKWRVVLMAVALLGAIGFQLVGPQILARFIDTAVADSVASQLLTLAFLYIGVALVEQTLRVISVYGASTIGWTATNNLRADLATHCLQLDMGFHKNRTPGELIERVDGDVTTLSRFFSQFTVIIVGNSILMLGVVVALFFVHPLAGLGCLIFTVIALGVMLRLRNIAVPYYAAYRQEAARFYSFATEQLTGREDIKANGARPFFMRQLFEINQDWMLVWHKARLASTTLWASSTGMFALGSIAALAIGAYLFNRELITIGMVFLIFNYFNQLIFPIQQIREEIELLQQADASMERIRDLFNEESRIDQGGTGQVAGQAFKVEVSDISFHYGRGAKDKEAADWVLQNVNFALEPGQTLGVLGRTGSGKSTLARLLLRMYDPQKGQIQLNGVSLPNVPLGDLRQRIGYVTQDVQIFQATVRDNVTFFDDQVSDEKLINLFAQLGLEEWLSRLPGGLDTLLGTDGGTLSAGEAQLLAVARVFLKDPGLVILDEASSRLDPATEQFMTQAVNQLFNRRTGIIIAHRLATLETVDQIMVMQDGAVTEFGRRDELAADADSRFAQLLRAGTIDLPASSNGSEQI
ncbi:MAG: ABC transporter ATP-binding protein [Chloroflexota bacterium]